MHLGKALELVATAQGKMPWEFFISTDRGVCTIPGLECSVKILTDGPGYCSKNPTGLPRNFAFKGLTSGLYHRNHGSSRSPSGMGAGYVVFTKGKDQDALLPDHRDPCHPPFPGVYFPPLRFPLPPCPPITLASMKYLPNVAFCEYPFGHCPFVGNINCVPRAG